jgi:hypothetical protein
MGSSHAVALVLGVAGLGTVCGGDGMVRRTPTGSCADLTCSFTDLSADGDGIVVGYHWDFGDGAEAATQNATHAYAPADNYVVELTVTGDSGRDEQPLAAGDRDRFADRPGGVNSPEPLRPGFPCPWIERSHVTPHAGGPLCAQL